MKKYEIYPGKYLFIEKMPTSVRAKIVCTAADILEGSWYEISPTSKDFRVRGGTGSCAIITWESGDIPSTTLVFSGTIITYRDVVFGQAISQ